MSKSATILLTALAVASCGGAGTGGTVSTMPSTASSTSGIPATTSSSTSRPPTTTTTTTALGATSTTALLQGNWAELPLVAYDAWDGIGLGWWDGSSWVQVEEGTPLPVEGGEDYQVALLGSDAVIEGGPPESGGCTVSYPEGLPGVQFDDGNALYTIIDDGAGGERSISGVAISAPWDITPRPVATGEPHRDLEAIALELLTDQGFDRDSARIVQIVDGDVDGDGVVESLVVVEDTELANAASDVYSIVFAVSSTAPDPEIVAESAYPAGEEGYPASFRVSALADLNGDGSMEVVASGEAWENTWVTVYEHASDGYEDRIDAGCGV